MNGVIQAIQDAEITLTSNTATLPFSIVDLRTRCAQNCQGFMNHNEGSALFSILDGGNYEVHFNANVTSAAAGQVALALFADGVPVQGTEMDEEVTTVGAFKSISFSKIVRVCCKGTVNLAIGSLPTVTYNGGATSVVTDTQVPTLKNANIYIERLS